MVTTVAKMDRDTIAMVNSMYRPMRGMVFEVGGMRLGINRRNTMRARRTEMERVIFS